MTAGLGGAGTWNLSNEFWGLNSNGTTVPYSAWNNLALDSAIFGGTAGTVTLAAPITLQNITFETTGYRITGSSLTLGGVNPQISHTSTAQVTIDSVLAGSNGLTLNGGATTGYVQLGASNTLTGGITLNSGARLVASGSNSLNGAANVVTVNGGGALQINHSNAFGGNTSAANLVLNPGANLWLGNQNLTHNITAHGGTIVIEDRFSGGNSTWTGNLTLTADTTLRVTNSGDGDNLFFAGNLTNTGANRLSLVLDEGGALNSNMWLSGTNSFTGGLTVERGHLILNGVDSAAAGAGNIVTINGGILRAETSSAFGGDIAASRLIINDGGRFRVGNNVSLAHNVTLTGGNAYIDGIGNATWNGTGVLTADTLLNLGFSDTINVTGNLFDNGAVLSLRTAGGNVRFSGNLSFTGGLRIGGDNTWFDGGTYTYTGDTVIESNARLLLNSTSLSPTSNIRFEGLNNNGHTTIIYGTNARPSITLLNGAGGGQLRWTGTGGFYALGSESDVTVNLGGAGGALTWNDGLFVPDGHALILGTNTNGSGARQVDFQNGIDLSGGVRQVRADAGNINDHAVISGMLTGTGGLNVIGGGLLELTHAGNNYTGATIVGDNATSGFGSLLFGAGSLPNNSNLQINGAGTGNLVQHGGYVLLNGASGSFTRALGTGAGEVQWTASGGFGAIGAPQTVNIGGAGATLTWGSGGFVPTGHALRFGGNFANSTINWQNGIDLGAVDRVINVNEGVGAGWQNTSELEVNLNGVIQGSGGLVLRGQGDVALNRLNTYGGTTWIGDNDPAQGSNMWVWANSLADAGVASSLGSRFDRRVELALGRAALQRRRHEHQPYSGAEPHRRRHPTFVQLRQRRAHLDGQYHHDRLRPERPAARRNLRYHHRRQWRRRRAERDIRPDLRWQRRDAYQRMERRILRDRRSLASDGGQHLHRRGEAGRLRDRGHHDRQRRRGIRRRRGRSRRRLPRFERHVALHRQRSHQRPIVLGLERFGYRIVRDRSTRAHQHRHRGQSERRLHSYARGKQHRQQHAGSDTGRRPHARGIRVELVPPGQRGRRALGPRHRQQRAGQRICWDDAYFRRSAEAGPCRRYHWWIRVTSSHGAAGSSQRSSLIRFEGTADGSGGVLGLTAASGGFFRGLTSVSDAFQNNNGTTVGADPDGSGPLPAYGISALDDDNFVQGVRWFASGGFAAWDGTQVVNLSGDGRELAWGTAGFVPTNQQLVFGYVTADGTVDFQNGINLGGAARNVHVNDGLAVRDALMSGVLRSVNALGGLVKTGAGALTLTANNTYAGVTTISAGTLEVGNGGTTGTLGSGAQATVAAGATLVANRSNAYTLSQNVIGDGTLVQRGAGVTTMATNSNIDHVVIEHGTLATPGTLLTDDVTFTDDGGGTLRVTGTMQTGAGTATLLTGGISNDTVIVAAGASVLMNGALGDGSDALDVAGTLNTTAGSLDLGAGSDTFTVRDNTNLIGTVLGGTGIDTLNANIASAATLGRIGTFETLTKSGVGVLNVVGPPISDFATVNVNAGTLNVGAGGEIAAPAAGTLTTTVAAGATLRVDGAFGCGTALDSLTVSGNVVGTGTIDQCGGDDLLTLNDTANVSSFTGTFSGGAHALGDTVNLNPTGTLNFAAGIVTNYERLSKTNTGTATLNGTHTYVGGTTIDGGTLDVNGALETPTIAVADGTTLNVDGQVHANGPTQTAITGSTGANTIVVAGGASLLASGDLGDGADVLDVGGTLDTGAGTLALGAGDDMLTIRENTTISGSVDGGVGIDTLNANISSVASFSAISTFESLMKSGAGTLNVTGLGVSDFSSVIVQAGTLNVGPSGSITAPAAGPLATTIAAGATLNVAGSFGCGSGADSITVAGNVSGAGTIDQCGGDDTLTLTDTADLSGFAGAIDGGANAAADTVVLNSCECADTGGRRGDELRSAAQRRRGHRDADRRTGIYRRHDDQRRHAAS